VTGRRTAAMSMLGIRTLLPRTPQSALLIGTGAQAAAHADALVEYFGVRNSGSPHATSNAPRLSAGRQRTPSAGRGQSAPGTDVARGIYRAPMW
jgi:hypothetical protein